MVFESFVTDLINKYLGDFVENLDKSQLKLGIWGGDVVLNELDLKESALNDLDLPVKVKAGHIGKLTLKIPWKNLYTEPVIAVIDGLYALAVPNVAIKYNAEKEEKEKQENKQKKLQSLEELKKLEAEKDQPKEKKTDSFAEKFATQVIKNLQVEIRNIHVRYEDEYTNPKRPFAVGVTLQELLFLTTDDKWKRCVIKEAVSQIHKMIKLESLAVYWSSHSEMYSRLDKATILKKLNIVSTENLNKDRFQYLIRPIRSEAHLRLNVKPEDQQFSNPKVYLLIIIEEISLSLAKLQYNDVLEMLEGFERVTLMGIYKKYNPNVPFSGHIKEWWMFAYTSILEESVRRRQKMWSWNHMRQHCDYKKRYKEMYMQKLENKKTSKNLQKELDECERYLDVLNITIIRQQAELESAKRGAKQVKEKTSGGWFGGLFGGGKKKLDGKETGDSKTIQEQFYEQFTPDEKKKLYAAIGYQENEADITVPKEFVAIHIVTKLSKFSVKLMDNEKNEQQLVNLQLTNTIAKVFQRPAANAVRVDVKMDEMSLLGHKQGEITPCMVMSQTVIGEQVMSLIDVMFETNPQDELCDARLNVNARPLQIVYDAVTVNELAEFFMPPRDIQLRQLSEAAKSKFEDFKEMTAAGLQHAINVQKYTEVLIDLQSSYVIIPHGGLLGNKQNDVTKLILDLGNLMVTSQKSDSADRVQQGSFEDIMLKAYDKFNIKLSSIQLLLAQTGENWQSARKAEKSAMHILYPVSINVLLETCMFENDARMAKVKVKGELPHLSLNMSDESLQQILSLVQSIPLPEEGPSVEQDKLAMGPSILPQGNIMESILAKKTQLLIGREDEPKKSLVKSVSQDMVNATDLELVFVLKEIIINIAQRNKYEDVPMLRLVVNDIGMEVMVRTFDLKVDTYLGGIYLQYLKMAAKSDSIINLVSSPQEKVGTKLLSVNYLKAKTDAPDFETTYKKTEQTIKIEFSQLEVLLHQECMLDLMMFVITIQPKLEESLSTEEKNKQNEDEKDKMETVKKKKQSKKDPDIIEISVLATLRQFSFSICTDTHQIMEADIKGIEASVTLQERQTLVCAVLKDIQITDPSLHTHYPNILMIQGSDVLNLDLAIYNDNTEGARYEDLSNVDIKVSVALGRLRFIFLNKFVLEILAFLDNFQAAQEQMKKASDTLAELSQEAMQKFQERAPRVALAVDMKAPIIIMPQNSKSFNVLMVDFGQLVIGNKFEMPGQRSSNEMPAVLDKMNIKLTDVKMLKAVLDAKMSTKSEIEILQPVSIEVEVCRNLTSNWYHSVPDIDISGTLNAVQICLSQEDFTTIMLVLNENLSEGQVTAEKKPATESVITDKTTDKEAPVKAESLVCAENEQITNPWCKLKFKFCVNSMGVTLYAGENHQTSGLSPRLTDNCIGHCELQLIALNGHMMTNNTISITVILRDLIIDDRRPQKKDGITRMMERSKKNVTISDGEVNMIDVSFVQEHSGSKVIVVHMSSLFVCVCLDFLMSVADLFVKGLTATADSSSTAVQTTKDSHRGRVTKITARADSSIVHVDMVVTVTIDRPEILMIEDQTNHSTNALMLDMEMMFKMRQSSESMDMSAVITNLEMVSCKYNNRASGAQILSPCSISFYSNMKNNQVAHIDVMTSDLILNISPATIRTMSSIVAGLSIQNEVSTKHDSTPADLWQMKKLSECDIWFLKAAPVTIFDNEANPEELVKQDEQLILKVPSIVVKLEGGVDNRTVPLLIAEMTFEGEINDWSSKLNVESTLKLEVAYYNEKMAVWEPLLEPVFSHGKYKPWELQLQVTKNIIEDLMENDDADVVTLPPPKMSIDLWAENCLELTMTKASLESLTNLGKAFGDAYKLIEPTQKSGEIIDPYVIKNMTGVDLHLKLDNTFEMPRAAVNGDIQLRFLDVLPLKNKTYEAGKLHKQASVTKASQDIEKKIIVFQAFGVFKEVTIKRSEKRLFHFDSPDKNITDKWAIVCDARATLGQKVITFRSSVQVTNHLQVPVDVYFKDPEGQLMPISQVGMDETYNFPVHTIYTPSSAFMFKPVKDGCDKVSGEVSWKGAENLGFKQLVCQSKSGLLPFYFKVTAEIESVFYESGDKQVKTTNFHLYPTAVLHNLLPYNVKVMLQGAPDNIQLDKGTSIPLDHACIGTTYMVIVIPNYLGLEWMGKRQLEIETPELSVWTFEAYNKTNKTTMNLGLHFKQGQGTTNLSLFCPYWMVNKTGLQIQYKAGDDDPVDHPAELSDIVMLSFKKSSIFGKKKASIRIGGGDWSDKFSLDTVGSSGIVQCKMKTRNWEAGVSIMFSCSGLTKVVTFTPYYMLVNTSPFTLRCKEVLTGSFWIDIPSKECVPYWPLQTDKEITMQASFINTDVSTEPFLINKPHRTLLRLNNEYGGVNAECQETESAMITTFNSYRVGMATVLIINHTDRCDIQFNQSGLKTSYVMEPGMAGLYTWESSLGKRELVWSCGEMKDQRNDLSKDGIDGFFYNSDTKVYWVSFLNGMQRVLLFTLDFTVAKAAQEAGELERIEHEITVRIQGVGLSLVNNDKQEEISYLGITSSGVIWEEKKRHFKALCWKTNQALEMAYQKFCQDLAYGKTREGNLEVDKMEVNFRDMLILKPKRRAIKRSFQDGVWIQYKASPHQVQFHAKINRIQFDNQMSRAVFPTILSPMSLPKSVAAESVPKPFTEVSMMVRKHEHSNVSQMKYFKVLIQEMQVKVDQAFINSMLELFNADQELTPEQEREQFQKDLGYTQNDLITTLGLSLASEQQMFYDFLHLSPIKVHMSFSLQGGSGDGLRLQIHANAINVFLQSVGVVLTDIQDVIFKLGYFERQHSFYNNKQMVKEMSTHYQSQAIKQMYVLVLGLDVLGNPFGLLRGMAEGIEDFFYEPYQGAIQGPEEFTEGLALGLKSLFGHAVGGAAGAVSRITGTIGKGIAALTLDDDYQKKRLEAMNKRPANIGEGLARGGKGLVMGVFDGVTGIVRKPVEGAKRDGVEGFFKGVGKGLIGVVTRPTSGVIDFASSSFEGIKRITENVGEIHRMRPPRCFFKDHLIRPYNKHEAEGYSVLMEIDKGKFCTDEYVAHLFVAKDERQIFLVTNKRLIYATCGDVFGHWDCDFTFMWAELKEKPKVSAKGIEIVHKEAEKKFLFGSSSSKKEIFVPDKKQAEWLVAKISQVYTAAMNLGI